MSVSKITTHIADALAKQPEHSKGKANNTLVLTAFATQIQELEDAWYDLYVLRRLGDAVGVQLDLLGRVVGQPRDGRNDADYERFISARIAANNSEGRIADLNRVARAVLGDDVAVITYSTGYPAGLTLEIYSDETTASTAAILIEFLRDTVLGGVRIQLHFLTDTIANSFTWIDEADHVTVNVNQGWDDAAAPGSGGFWSSVIV